MYIYILKQTKMTKTITFDVREITYDNGLTEIAIVTPKQWA